MPSTAAKRATAPLPRPESTLEPLPRQALRGFERFAVPLGEAVNRNIATKRALSGYARRVSYPFVRGLSQVRWKIFGLENMADLRPERGVILVSNHRSFFDMYVAAASIFHHARFIDRLYFPVRSGFFYDHPLGPVINLLMSGHAMWPPMFRDDRRQQLNEIGLRQMAWALSRPGTVLGIHPEGARQKGDDPYVLGPARPGVGRLVERCHPDTVVLPFFILGLGNDLLREARIRLRLLEGPDIRIHWAPAIRGGDLCETDTDPAAIAEHLLQIVHELGRADRHLRTSDRRT